MARTASVPQPVPSVEPLPRDSQPSPSAQAADPAPPPSRLQEIFRRIAQGTAAAVGSAWAFVVALLAIVVWGITGPMFGFSDTWQLVINTGTTIVTFLMVFMIQNTQNRDAKAIHLKLDELLRAVTRARTSLVNLEELSDDELEKLRREFQALRAQHEDLVETHQAVAASATAVAAAAKDVVGAKRSTDDASRR